MGRSRRSSRRTRFTEALLLAAVALAMLALSSPAVARPSVHMVIYPHTLPAPTLITVLCLAAVVAIAIVAGVVLASRPGPQVKAEAAAREQIQAPRVKQVSRQRQAAV
jgi:hypothetical protein